MNIPACQHRGTIHGEIAFCRSDKVPAKDRRWLVLLSVCEACPVANYPNKVYPAVEVDEIAEAVQADYSFVPPSIAGDFPPCVFRGDHIEDKAADLCGLRGQIFEVRQCNHPDRPGRCVAQKICFRQDETACTLCDLRATDGSRD